jgi:hypothetical protein
MFDNLVRNGSFWLSLLLIVAGVVAKDTYLYGIQRDMNFEPHHILQEIDCHLGKSRYTAFDSASQDDRESMSLSEAQVDEKQPPTHVEMVSINRVAPV